MRRAHKDIPGSIKRARATFAFWERERRLGRYVGREYLSALHRLRSVTGKTEDMIRDLQRT